MSETARLDVLQGNSYMARASQDGSSGEHSIVRLVNKAGSGKNIFLEYIMVASNSNTGVVLNECSPQNLSTTFQANNRLITMPSLSAGVFEISRETNSNQNPDALGGYARFQIREQTTEILNLVNTPLIMPPDSGFQFSALTENVRLVVTTLFTVKDG